MHISIGVLMRAVNWKIATTKMHTFSINILKNRQQNVVTFPHNFSILVIRIFYRIGAGQFVVAISNDYLIS